MASGSRGRPVDQGPALGGCRNEIAACHARQLVSIRVTADTLIETGTDDIRTVSRTTSQPIRNLKAQRSARPPMFPRPSVKRD
jgi:hypothetical protein